MSLAVVLQDHPRPYLGIIHIDFYEYHITILLTQTLKRNKKNYAVTVSQGKLPEKMHLHKQKGWCCLNC